MKNHYTKQGPSAYSIWHVAKYTKMILSRWNNYFLANLCFFVKSIYAIGSGKGIENAKPLSCCVHNTTTCNRNYSNFSLDLKFLLDGVSFTSSWAPVNIVWCCLYFLMVFTPLLDLGTDQRCYHLFSAGLGEVAAKTSCGPRRTLGDGSIYIYIYPYGSKHLLRRYITTWFMPQIAKYFPRSKKVLGSIGLWFIYWMGHEDT